MASSKSAEGCSQARARCVKKLSGAAMRAQDSGQRPIFRVKVDMVVLSFQVTDNKGHYINGLKPTDFRILEDGIRDA